MKCIFTVQQWGSVCWKVLIITAKNYPEKFDWQESRQIEMFLNQLQYVLPCVKCRHHYHSYLRSNPPNLHTREELLHWLFTLYNLIKAAENYSVTYERFLSFADNYNTKYFWELMYYIACGYERNTFDNQLAYKQFFEYLGYLKPYSKFQKAFKEISIDAYLLNSDTLMYYMSIIYNFIYN